MSVGVSMETLMQSRRRIGDSLKLEVLKESGAKFDGLGHVFEKLAMKVRSGSSHFVEDATAGELRQIEPVGGAEH